MSDFNHLSDHKSFVAKIDWLAFTYKSVTTDPNSVDQYEQFFQVFPELLDLSVGGIEVKIKEVAGDRFYNRVVMFNDFLRVAYRDCPFNCGDEFQRNMGVNVSIPAHGLEYFFNLLGYEKHQVKEVLELLQKRRCTISRLDIAFDDFTKTFKPYEWGLFAMQKRLVSKYKTFDYKASGRGVSDTFYIGKRSAGKLLRIYDKDAESNGDIPAIRYEFEIHGKYCKDYANYIIKNGYLPDFPTIFSKFISKVLIEDNKNKNHSQAKADPEYLAFLEFAKLSFSEQLEISSFASKEDRLKRSTKWVLTQLMPTIKTFIRVYGMDNFKLLYELSDCHSLDDVFRSNYKLHKYEYDQYLEKLLSGISA